MIRFDLTTLRNNRVRSGRLGLRVHLQAFERHPHQLAELGVDLTQSGSVKVDVLKRGGVAQAGKLGLVSDFGKEAERKGERFQPWNGMMNEIREHAPQHSHLAQSRQVDEGIDMDLADGIAGQIESNQTTGRLVPPIPLFA